MIFLYIWFTWLLAFVKISTYIILFHYSVIDYFSLELVWLERQKLLKISRRQHNGASQMAKDRKIWASKIINETDW